MKRFFILLAALLCWTAASADEAAIRNIKIGCVLDSLGTAHITEWWDVTAVRGTEWYLVRENLGDIKIESLSVSDETGKVYENIGSWNTGASFNDKAGRCGINKTGKGCELCWGLGSYGDHVYEVKYKMTNAAKSLNDYDMLHLQFISDELSSQPEHFKLVLQIPNVQLDTTIARIWGFGYVGQVWFEKGCVVMESTEQFSYDSSVILLMKLNKGIIKPQSTLDFDFDSHLKQAMKNSDWEDQAPKSGFERFVEGVINAVAAILAVLYMGGWVPLVLILAWFGNIAAKKRWLGTTNKSRVPWKREIPFEGDMYCANYVINRLETGNGKAKIAAAMILKMIQIGALSVRKDEKGKIEISFKDRSAIDDSDSGMVKLFQMMKDASGSDHILQESEFKKWSDANKKKVSDWVNEVKRASESNMKMKRYLSGNIPSAEGTKETRKLYGLRNFLKEFTMVDIRESQEVLLWQDYLVYAAMFGIADRVSKELKEIDPKAFEEINIDPGSLTRTIYVADRLASSITSAKSAYEASQRSSSYGGSGYSGGGGHSSFGGGGGFSGGGHGGGCR